MEEMNKLVRKRGGIKSKLTAFKTFVKKTATSLADENVDVSTKAILIRELEGRINKLEAIEQEFSLTQNEIEEICKDEDIEVQYKERESFDDMYFQQEAIAKQLLHENTPHDDNHDQGASLAGSVKSSEHCESQTKSRKLTFPQIQLPTFNGNFENWLEFRDTYTTLIHNDTELDDLEKFHYLRSALVDSATGALRSIPFEAKNYELAWTHVCNRFNNDSMIVTNHIKAIINLPTVQKESFNELNKLLDEANKHLISWSAIQTAKEQFDSLIIHILCSKLDKYTQIKWDESKSTDSLPTFEQFESFLKKRTEKLYTRDQNITKVENKPKSQYKTFVTSQKACEICKEEHQIFKCAEFLKSSISERVNRIKSLKLCMNCLKSGHLAKNCQSSKCRKCKGYHNTLLHFEQTKQKSDTSTENSEPEQTTSASITLTSLSKQVCQQRSKQVLLSTAVIFVLDKQGNKHKTRCLLDSGSHLNFITNDLSTRLSLKKFNISQSVTGINQETLYVNSMTKTTIQSQFNGFKATLDFLIIPQITDNLPSQDIDTKGWNIPTKISLADQGYDKSLPVDMLLGAEIFWSLLCVGQISLGVNMPIMHKTKLGWILSGPIITTTKRARNTNAVCNLSLQQLNSKLEHFWELENQQTQNVSHKLTPEESMCEQHFQKHTTRNAEGQFVVNLPLRTDATQLGDSKEIATKRLLQLERKLHNKSELLLQYQQFMTEYQKLGHMELIISENNDQMSQKPVYYLPHHAVVKADSLTTKLRVVFDGSAKSDNGVSLNNIMMVGPTVQPELFSIILRFRTHKIALTADIEKMYRQVRVHEDDQDLQRILWRDLPEHTIKTFRLCTVTYGTAAAPYLATRCLSQIAQDVDCPLTKQIIQNDFYVDDLLTGFESVEEAIKMQETLDKTLKSYSFNLRKWCSNNKEVTKKLVTADNDHHFIDLSKEDIVKTLGLGWKPADDIFQYLFKEHEDNRRVTKRNILSSIAKIFDPLGLIGPVIVISKLILQEVWQQKLDWDESVPVTIFTTWNRFKAELPLLNKIQIERCVIPINNATNFQLHCFSDASEKAYGACVYLRSVNDKSEISCKLICSKTRVAPLKQISLPRLELCGALLAAQLSKKVSNILQVQHTIHLWTDSTIVLAWINGNPTQWHTFVANRVSQVQEITDIKEWRHVKSEENPADMLTRGRLPSQIITANLWWAGPSWLSSENNNWPTYNEISTETIPEQRTKRQIIALPIQGNTSIFNKYSKLIKLQRVVAFCLRFINNCKTQAKNRVKECLMVEELKNSMNRLSLMAQCQMFPEELHHLTKTNTVEKTSKLLSLNPFLDEHGLIRVGGRLKHAAIDYNEKHPIILTSNHPLTKLIIEYEHKRLLHAGCQSTLTSIRTKFWILSGKNAVKKVIRNCVPCFKVHPTQLNHLMGDLPIQRVTPTRPFLSCGVDFAGPFFIKEGSSRSKKLIKSYLCVFVCFSTKAVHLELAKDLTTEAFINCLRRFIARRGKCKDIFSDNGTNFIGARSELKELGEILTSKSQQERIVDCLLPDHIQWHLIPPRSPHFGGLWEASVKSAKFHIRRVIGNAHLTYEELYTVIVQIEGCLNSRPISPLSNDPHDLLPLTPGHFLVGGPLSAINQPDFKDVKLNRLSRYQRNQQLLKNFWDRWHKDYLQELQQRSKWKQQQPNLLEPGTMVIIRDDNMPPLKWKMGRIIQLHPGADGVTRVVTVKVNNGEIKRPVKKVCMLPIS